MSCISAMTRKAKKYLLLKKSPRFFILAHFIIIKNDKIVNPMQNAAIIFCFNVRVFLFSSAAVVTTGAHDAHKLPNAV